MVMLTLLSILLALAFVAAGGAKVALAGPPPVELRGMGLQDQAIRGIGGLEVAGALGLLIGLGVGVLGGFAALGLTVLMVGAVVFHVRQADPPPKYAPAAVLGLLSFVVLLIHVF